MKIKSAKSFRQWYKTEVKEIEIDNRIHDENFIGTYYRKDGEKTIKGFFEMYHGDKGDIKSYLPSILKIAEDGQAIYEFLQNAVDSGSTHFYIFYDENYFLAINNGRPFEIEGLHSILNIAQTTKKDPDKIGRFGIGFKLAHRLVGKNEGVDELVNGNKGPVLFSWSNLKDFESLLANETIEESNDIQNTSDLPFLLKILLTNFPAGPNELVKDVNYQDHVLFPKTELDELIAFLNQNFDKHSQSLNKDALSQGSLFFIKLGEDKKTLLDEDYKNLENGIQYSMNTLKGLEKVYINEHDIEKTPLQLEKGVIEKKSKAFEQIDPEYKEFDIKFAIGFNNINFGSKTAYQPIQELKAKPNIYKYFPMGDEINGLAFIIHCDSFSNEANRRKLHQEDGNKNLFSSLANFITQKLDEYKISDRSKFLNIYAAILLSDEPNKENNKWLHEPFYKPLHDYLKVNVPTKKGISNHCANVKINKLKMALNLADFGLEHIE
jgi:Histidine kinase-, DNA gyrase B-, and HSP90-like ATPase